MMTEGRTCSKVYYHRQAFQDHLRSQHNALDQDRVSSKLTSCHMAHNGQGRFYCGFCVKVIELKRKGWDAWAERFDHVDDHFMGRHGQPAKNIKDWVPITGDKSEGESASSCPTTTHQQLTSDGSESSGSGSPEESSPDATQSEGSPPNVNTPREEEERPRKRKSTDEVPIDQATKRAKNTEGDPVIHCVCCTSPYDRNTDNLDSANVPSCITLRLSSNVVIAQMHIVSAPIVPAASLIQ